MARCRRCGQRGESWRLVKVFDFSNRLIGYECHCVALQSPYKHNADRGMWSKATKIMDVIERRVGDERD